LIKHKFAFDLLQAAMRNLLLGLILAGVAVELVFLIGIAQRSIRTTKAYAILLVILAVLITMKAVKDEPADLVNAAFTGGLAWVAFSYLRDLETIRDNCVRLGLDVI